MSSQLTLSCEPTILFREVGALRKRRSKRGGGLEIPVAFVVGSSVLDGEAGCVRSSGCLALRWWGLESAS